MFWIRGHKLESDRKMEEKKRNNFKLINEFEVIRKTFIKFESVASIP